MTTGHLLLALAVLAHASSSRAHGCHCSPHATLRSTVCTSALSVVGYAVAQWDSCRGLCTNGTGGHMTYVVRVLQTVSGPAPDDGVALFVSSAASAACAAPLELHRAYLLNGFAAPPLNATDASVCARDAPPVHKLVSCGFNLPWDALEDADKAWLFEKPLNCTNTTDETPGLPVLPAP